MKTLVQINTVCNGSTGKIMCSIADEAEKQGFKTYNFFGRGNPKKEDRDIRIENKLSVYFHVLLSRLGFDGRGSYFATKKLIKKLKEINPDVIHIHNVHGYYLNYKVFFTYLKNEFKGKIVWTLHDCWSFTGHCCHFTHVNCAKWQQHCCNCPIRRDYPKAYFDHSEKDFDFKKNLFMNLKNCTLVTPSKWLAGKVEQSFMKVHPVKVINNGIDLNTFKIYSKAELKEIYNKYNIPKNKKIILGVASGFGKRKGLFDFLELSKKLNNNYQIVLVGISKTDRKKIGKCNIILIDRTENQIELSKLYNIASLYLNLSNQETFGLTTIEAMACGKIVIAYNLTAIPEPIGKFGYIIKYNNHRVDEIERIIENKNAFKIKKNEIIDRAKLFSNEIQCNNYLSIYY